MTLIVLAEDDEDLTDKYLTELERAGFEVIHAASGFDLKDLVKKHKPAIILSDTHLEEIDGDEACKELLREGLIDNAFLIAMSAVRDYDSCWKNVAHEFLYKASITDLGTTTNHLYQKFLANPNPRRYKDFSPICSRSQGQVGRGGNCP
jgi:CheY-like chemotaxis protein